MPKEHLAFLKLENFSVPLSQDINTFPTVKAFEQALVAGSLSHHFSKRMDTSQIIASHYGINYHFPLTDLKLMNFFHGLPSGLKRRHGKGRYLMRKTLAPFLPKRIIWRNNKAGATTPAASLCYIKQLPELFLQRVSPQGLLADYIDIPKLTAYIEKNSQSNLETGVMRLATMVMMFSHLEDWLGKNAGHVL